MERRLREAISETEAINQRGPEGGEGSVVTVIGYRDLTSFMTKPIPKRLLQERISVKFNYEFSCIFY